MRSLTVSVFAAPVCVCACPLQFGGQTPLKISTALQQALDENPIPTASGNGNVAIWGTQPDAIDEAEDRDRWGGGTGDVGCVCVWGGCWLQQAGCV
jgi:hypothetical protein